MDFRDRAEALAAALKELFKQHEPRAIRAPDYGWGEGEEAMREAAVEWRSRALICAAEGQYEAAFRLAKSTGVPSEEADALKTLLYG